MEAKELSELEILDRALHELENYYNCYQTEKTKSKLSHLKKDREKACNNMYGYAKFIKRELTENPYILSVIQDGSSFQFEDFVTHVDSDMPDYLKKIRSRIVALKEE